jgi:hypothetical protein
VGLGVELRSRAQGSGLKGLRFGVECCQGLGFRGKGFGFRGKGLRFRL